MTGRPLTITPEFAEGLTRLGNGENVFLTGRAGTGKSTLVRQFLATTPRRVVVAAPTGIAALNVEGYTIHRLFSFHAGTTLDEVRSARYSPRRFAKTLGNLDTLILDEASMVRADLFDCLAVALERFGPKPGTPFGGVQVVLVGDLFQLPPVVTEGEKEFFQTRYSSPYFFAADAFDHFPVIELTTVFRQIGDTRMVELLNDVREGALLDAARQELNARTEPDFRPPIDEFWLTLTTTNPIAAARNRETLALLPEPELSHRGITAGELDGFELPVAEQLTYKVGAQIMLVTNDPADRWVNGTIGRITAHRIDQGRPVARVLLPTGQEVEVGPHTWEITRPVVEGATLRHEIVGTYTQLPFQLAWAITIHKSQGQTLDRVVVDLSGGTFADGQLYVALSRCTSLGGLVLRRPVQPRDLKTDHRIRRFLLAGRPRARSVGNAYLAVCVVGEEGRMWRPRPVELAVVTDDGLELTTLINPTRDLGTARTEFGISAIDVRLAPLLTEAWAALAPRLAGRVPVGVDIDRQLRDVDYEFKRNGSVVTMPLGVELETHGVSAENIARSAAGTALERAKAVRDIARSTHPYMGETVEVFPTVDHGGGYLLTRGGRADCFHPGATNDVLIHDLRAKAGGGPLDRESTALLRDVENRLGCQLIDPDIVGEAADIATVLIPGARICFTGTVLDDAGREVTRGDLEALAERCGLQPVASVTKKRCDALICAEAGTMSGKGRKAAEYGKPMFTAKEFLCWADPQ
ncbi:AAA family ATPase [Nocardia rhizosphaerae]|uniref:AAA family ATPase n=1 Tax=Nocardia rhizosphaerae TaxID=1691571 RepID=A0ABV8L9N9_9NOCA